MNTPAVPLQSMALRVSDTDHPIALVIGISSFLQTLKKFNGVVDQISTVNINALRARLKCSSDR